ncbi:hypothetical protein [Rossellomorea marisflavi]|uniref:hypothetical protein n=1 Tax=Rossellomorea marisflavi TaxID=189381 RepID=UPI003458D862
MNKKWGLGLYLPLSIIAILILASFLLPIFYPGFDKDTVKYLKDASGKIYAAPPFSPVEMPPLGSERSGLNLFWLLISGAKYTILATIAIAFLRMVFGFISGLVYTFLPKLVVKHAKGVAEVFQFIPLVIIVYALLHYVDKAYQSAALGSNTYIIIQVIAIAIVIIPSLGIYMGEEMKLFMHNEFIEASRTLGGTNRHLIRTHLWPQFLRHSIVLFSEQISQTLALLIQLGILSLTLGGLRVLPGGTDSDPIYFNVKYEWASMISMNTNAIFVSPWLLVAPLLFFAVLIFLFNTISSNLKKLLLEENVGNKPSMKKKELDSGKHYSRNEHFEMVKGEGKTR